MTFFLTYADNNAVTFFAKQGFTTEVTRPREQVLCWVLHVLYPLENAVLSYCFFSTCKSHKHAASQCCITSSICNIWTLSIASHWAFIYSAHDQSHLSSREQSYHTDLTLKSDLVSVWLHSNMSKFVNVQCSRGYCSTSQQSVMWPCIHMLTESLAIRNCCHEKTCVWLQEIIVSHGNHSQSWDQYANYAWLLISVELQFIIIPHHNLSLNAQSSWLDMTS